MIKKTELLGYLLGSGSATQLIAALIFAYAGATIFLLVRADKGVKTNPVSPVKFSWRYLWSDSNKRILATILLIPIFIRFSREFLGSEITMSISFLLGLSCDKIIGWLWVIKGPAPTKD